MKYLEILHLQESFIDLNFEDDQFDIDWESKKYMHDIYNNEDSSARIIIYPTILFAVNTEQISEVYETIEHISDESEAA